MLKFFYRRKIRKMAAEARAYAEKLLRDPPAPSPAPKPQRKPEPVPERPAPVDDDIKQLAAAAAASGIRFSMKRPIAASDPPAGGLRCSAKGSPPASKPQGSAKGAGTEKKANKIDPAPECSPLDQSLRGLSGAASPAETLRVLEQSTERSFVDKMTDYIRVKDLRPSDVYKSAQVDRRLFSKIMSDRAYQPSKDTALAFSYALGLTLPQANDLLSRAGYVLSHSSKRDLLLEYFFREGIYNLQDINEVLFRLNQKVIGR